MDHRDTQGQTPFRANGSHTLGGAALGSLCSGLVAAFSVALVVLVLSPCGNPGRLNTGAREQKQINFSQTIK